MSSTVLTRTLLDFGASLWDSEAVADEFPGLYDEGPLDTRVLEFATGPLGGRSFAPGARMSGCATGAQPSRCC